MRYRRLSVRWSWALDICLSSGGQRLTYLACAIVGTEFGGVIGQKIHASPSIFIVRVIVELIRIFCHDLHLHFTCACWASPVVAGKCDVCSVGQGGVRRKVVGYRSTVESQILRVWNIAQDGQIVCEGHCPLTGLRRPSCSRSGESCQLQCVRAGCR